MTHKVWFTTKCHQAPGFCAVSYVNDFLADDYRLTDSIRAKPYDSVEGKDMAECALEICKKFTRIIGSRKLVFADRIGGFQYSYVMRHLKDGTRFKNIYKTPPRPLEIEWEIRVSKPYVNCNSGNEVMEMTCVRLTNNAGELYDDL